MRYKILVVDDELEIRDTLIQTLEAPDREFLQSGDGESALEIVKTTHLDLIITDLSMPKMNGFELLRKIKMSGQSPCIIVLTGQADQMVANQIRPHGVHHFINKPWNSEQFSLIVNNCFEKLKSNKPYRD